MTPITPRRVLAIAAMLVALLVPATANAAQHQHAATSQGWRLPQHAWNVDQIVNIARSSNANYFAMGGSYTGNGHWYMGLQQLGDGRRVARFSIWDSKTALAPPGGSCRPFGGEGVGVTCELPFAWVTGRTYKYRTWLLGNSNGQNLWGAWIIDTVTGKETSLGLIAAPRGTGHINWSYSFNEYWGNAVPCWAVPTSNAFFQAARVNQGPYATYDSAGTVGSCSGGRVVQGFGGVGLYLGVR